MEHMSQEHKEKMQEVMAMMVKMRGMMDEMEAYMQEMMGAEEDPQVKRKKYFSKTQEEREQIDEKNVMHRGMEDEDASEE